MDVEDDGLLPPCDEVLAGIVVAPPPIVVMIVFPEASVVVMTWPSLVDVEGPWVVEGTVVVGALVGSSTLELGGKEVGTEEVSAGGLTVVEGSTGVVVTVLLSRFANLAIFRIPVANPGSSLCMASIAVRSSGNMPCWNFLGEKSCSAA